MAVRPKRKDPISTRPIYLPKVPARELPRVARPTAPTEGLRVRIYVDGAPADLDVEGLAQALARAQTLPTTVEGELLAALAGRAHSQVRDTVAALAHRLAWARIRDPAKREYRLLPLHGEVDQEEARFRAWSLPQYEGLRAPSPAAAALYDADEVQAAYRELIPLEGDGDAICIVITDRRLARWDAAANRWTPVRVLPGVPILASVARAEGPINLDALVEEIRQALEGSG